MTADDLHEWVSFEDPDEERTWVFDLTFLTSNWTCIFGNGCKGVLTEDATELSQGCCSYGAHLVDEDDRARVEQAAARLEEEEWQFAVEARALGSTTVEDDEGTVTTRLVDDACIFLNRPGFATGPGCALHIGAKNRGESYLPWKPEVCWQLPLRRDDHVDDLGYVTSTVREWKRRDWGDGGREFHWWCTASPEAFVGAEPVYVALAEELQALTSPVAYELLLEHIRGRLTAPRNAGRPVFLAHPAVRERRDQPGGRSTTP